MDPSLAVEPGVLPRHVSAVVVGSGFAGIGAAITLRDEGVDHIVIERARDLGGTWRDNTYPDCACDVPSHLYSFSFAPNPNWSRTFSPQPEILAYLRDTAQRFGVERNVRFGCELLDARWDDAEQRWDITTSLGSMTANVLILGTGGLSEPSVPSFPGLERFEGVTFHSAAWRHDHELRGERVAIVGTGASGIQFTPYVQQRAKHVTVFQRTAPWVLPRRDRAITRFERVLFRLFPALQGAMRGSIYAGRESWVLGFIRPSIMKLAERRALRFLHSQVRDPELRRVLTPGFRLGCKRVLLSNEYYAALAQPNAEVVTDTIVEISPRGIVTESPAGIRREHEFDTIIFATGFHVTDPPIATRVHGRDGRTLAGHWSETGLQALRGTTIAGFPNLFMLTGPNTGLGHTSVVLMIEAQLDYLKQALRGMRAHGVAALEPKRAVQDRYNDRIQRMLAGTVWNTGGCRSWYLDARGRNSTLWPTFTTTFKRELARFDPHEYHLWSRKRGVVARAGQGASAR